MKILIGDDDPTAAVLIRPTSNDRWTEFSAMIAPRTRDVVIKRSREVDLSTKYFLLTGEGA
jgi:hypothetical protein